MTTSPAPETRAVSAAAKATRTHGAAVLDSGSSENGKCNTDHSVTAPAANPTTAAGTSRAASLDLSVWAVNPDDRRSRAVGAGIGDGRLWGLSAPRITMRSSTEAVEGAAERLDGLIDGEHRVGRRRACQRRQLIVVETLR
jgi:hypothetical protein